MAPFSDPLCRDCRDLQLEVKATRLIGRTPVCDEHMRKRLGMPPETRGISPVAAARAAIETTKEEKAMPKRTDEGTRAKILEDHAAGMGINAIATKHGMAWGTVNAIVKANGGKHGGGGVPKAPRPLGAAGPRNLCSAARL
ncbi:MAG: hypothetical protein LAN84_09760 [Acidobacteriia bacterium]|nr:hypothetical protein [Terriglobia bacterium]